MTKLKIAVLIVAIFCMSATAMADPIFFSNPYDVNSAAAFTSSQVNGDDFYQCAADYDYDGSKIITDFHWWGATSGPNSITAFEFSIWADNGSDEPGAFVYGETIVGDAGATATGDLNNSDAVYKYGFDLANPFSGAAGKYWFSVYAITTDYSWYWGVSDTRHFADDVQYDYFNNDFIAGNPYGGDFAYELSGVDAVPEPATMTLFGLGLLGAGLARRRKKNS